jgi:hypothetical protein
MDQGGVMFFILAVALELFCDYVPENTSVDNTLFKAKEIRAELKKKGWELRGFEKRPEDTWVFWNLGPRIKEGDLEGRPKDKMVLFMWEPPLVQPELYDPKMQAHFGKIFTWDDDLVDGKRFFKFHYPVLKEKMSGLPSFEEKKFCTMIARKLKSKDSKELHSERRSMAEYFEGKRGEFDLYGPAWSKKKFKNYKGPIDDKMAVLKNYKFAICYENTRDIKGYVTEKIFDCFAAGVVPVYWGASNVTDYIPEECFIDRRKFKDNRAVYEFMKKMKKEEYEKYLKSAEAFLKSEKAHVFSADYFAKTFLQI